MADRRFGPINKFGTSSKFGASSGVDGDIRWVVEVDWDNDGAFDGSNEAHWLKDAETFIGRQTMFKPNGTGLEFVSPGYATIHLDNSSARYSGWNTSSPLYPNVRPGRLARVRIYSPSLNAFSDEIYGRVKDIQTYGSGLEAYAVLEIMDRQSEIDGIKMPMSTTVFTAPSDIIDLHLQGIGYDALTIQGTPLDNVGERFYSTGDDTYGFVFHELASDYLSIFYFDGAGLPTWRNRGYSGSSQRDFVESDLLKEIKLPQPWSNIRNVLHIVVNQILDGTSSVVVSNQSVGIYFSAGQTLLIYVQHIVNGVTVVCEPYPLPDQYLNITYLANTSSDGSGTDLTADFDLVDSQNLGIGGFIEITNTSAFGGYLNELEITALALLPAGRFDFFYPENPSTVEQPRELYLNSRYYQRPEIGIDLRDDVVDFFATQQKYAVIQLEANPTKQFFNSSNTTLGLFGDVTLTTATNGLNNEPFIIGGKQHKTLGNPQYVRTTLWLEPGI